MLNYNDHRKYWTIFYDNLKSGRTKQPFWGGRPVSNRRPLEPQSSALTS